MKEPKAIKPMKQVTLKRKLSVFAIFYLLLTAYTVFRVYGVLNIQNAIDYVKDVNVDGTDFTGLSNFMIGAFNGVFFLIGFFMNVVFNILVILGLNMAFNYIYFRTLCLEKEKFISSIKKIIWIISITGVAISILISLNTNVIHLILTIIFIYFPLPVLVQVLFFKKLKKIYKSVG